LAADLKGLPTVIQEQNAYAGITNRLLGRRAVRIHVAFVEAKDHLPAEKCVYSGNPTRRELIEADSSEGRARYGVPPNAFVIAVLGGSLGSRAINEAVAGNIAAMLSDDMTFLIWQCGIQYFEEMRARVNEHPRLRLCAYIDRMDLTYAAADLVLSRAGAITCSELMVTGTPSVLVPSPNVAEDHQTYNARSMAYAGAAIHVPESEVEMRLIYEIDTLRKNRRRLSEMAAEALKVARPDAALHIAEDILNVIGYKHAVEA
jgi:UDP-N-acetylglucosamine--N-acetylmuramyl-(pentapeptide) pyrophosphoryl-undecaprenol N-acetylglucosamine transferase